MREKDETLKLIVGGSLSGSIINYTAALFKTIYGFGQEFGGAIRRISTGKLCPLK